MRGVRYAITAAMIAGAVLASHAQAQEQFFVRGEFNDWGLDDPMTEVGPGHYSRTVSGLTAGNLYGYKVAVEDWSASWPGSDGRIQAHPDGTMTFHFFPGPHTDGWQPDADRVGYSDSAHGWDIMGSFNGWSDPVVTLDNLGGGVYSGSTVVPAPGTYQYKFRMAGSWDISIGDNFGNAAADLSYTTTSPDELVVFTLDLPNGRHQAIPEPASVGLVGLAGAMLLVRRRR